MASNCSIGVDKSDSCSRCFFLDFFQLMNNKQSFINGRTCTLVIRLTFTVLGAIAFIPGLVLLPANNVSSGAPLGAEDIPLTAGTDYVDGFVRAAALRSL